MEYVVWRYLTQAPIPHYVEAMHNDGGDRYSYTDNPERAMRMSELSAKRFCGYMRDCATVGFYSPR